MMEQNWWQPREARVCRRSIGSSRRRPKSLGSPTFVTAGELHWGQDRLDFVDRALAAFSARGQSSTA